jgi:hypothetical protein
MGEQEEHAITPRREFVRDLRISAPIGWSAGATDCIVCDRPRSRIPTVMPTETLSITGQRGLSIPATLMRAGGRELAVLFPGLTYRNTLPVMHFSRLLMLSRGADVFAVNYAYDRARGFRDSSDREQLEWIAADGRAALATALGLGSYGRVTVIGKSLGTGMGRSRRAATVIGKSLGTLAMGWAVPDEPRLAGADLVWLTPSLRRNGLSERMLSFKQRSIIVIGTRDPAYDEPLIEEFREGGIEVVVVPDADHGLERQGDALGSVAALGEMVHHVSAWLDRRR